MTVARFAVKEDDERSKAPEGAANADPEDGEAFGFWPRLGALKGERVSTRSFEARSSCNNHSNINITNI